MDIFGQLKKAQLENTTTNPTKRGEVVFHTSDSKVKYSDGSNPRTVVNTDEAQTLTNKTLTSPAITTPTGIVKGDVGLGNVDNTSDENKPVSTAQAAADLSVANAAASALSSHANKTDTHGVTGAIVGTTDEQSLSNKTLVDPIIEDTLILKNRIVTPSNPDSDSKKLYSKNGGLYFLNDAGVEVEIIAPSSVIDKNRILQNVTTRYWESQWIDNGDTDDGEDMHSVAWSPSLGRFVAVGLQGGGSRNGFYSSNGYTWSAINIDEAANLQKICWSEELEMFIAVGFETIKYSTDGINFSEVTSLTTSLTYGFLFTSVCWSKELEMFVAVGSETATNLNGRKRPICFTSTDGLNWTQRTTPVYAGDFDGEYLHSVCWSKELSLFAAIRISDLGITNANYSIITSSDGITWTEREVPGSDGYFEVACSLAWSPKLAKFLLLGNGIAFSSVDGINWNEVTESNLVGYPSVLIWCDDLEMFVASTGGVQTSQDGVTWLTRRIDTSKSSSGPSKDICWSPELSVFVGLYNFALYRSR